jgi:uncharacterized protein YbjT (DUF2867 family)
MAEGKTILVTGATGAQGGGVARHLLKGGKFRVRCLTRDPTSAKAAALAKGGAEVVKGDLAERRSVEAALAGCYGCFGVTNFWEHFAGERQQGRNLVEAVKSAGVQHFVFSTLPSAKEITKGAIEVPHLDIKADVEKYARELRLGATFVSVAFYFENFLTHFLPQRQADGTLAFGFPQGDTPLAGVAVEDTGGVVAVIFGRPGEFRDRTVGIVGDDLPGKKYAEIMSRVLGQKVVYNYIPRETYAAFGFPGAQELADMFEFNRLHVPERRTDMAESRALYPGMLSFEEWMKANKQQFHAAVAKV